MPVKRTYRRKKGARRKRRVVRKYRLSRRIPNNSRTYTFTRSYFAGQIVSAAALPVFGSLFFTLGNLPNSSEFTSLFDEYRVGKLTFNFVPIKLQGNIDAAYSCPELFTIVDKDDSTVPSSINEFLQSPSMRIVSSSRRFRRYFYPKFASSMYVSAVSTGYGARNGWVDCTNSDVPHYGLKYMMNPSTIASAFIYQVFVTATVKFRGVR